MSEQYTDIKGFTRREWEIIVHRLEVSDAIVEVLTDDDDTYSAEQLTDEIDLLLFGGCTRTQFNEIEVLILRECLEGSTFFADIHDAVARDEITRGSMLAYFKAATSLGEKFNVKVTTH